MAKKRKSSGAKKFLSYVKYGAILFALVGVVMAAFAFVKYGDSAFSGFQVIFGYTGKVDFLSAVTLNTKVLSFSIMAFLAVLLPLVGAFSVACKNKIVRLVGALLMIVGCVLSFLVPNFIVFAKDAYATIASGIGASLGVGAILSGVFFGLGALCNLYAVVEK